jgi:hypothetical protein
MENVMPGAYRVTASVASAGPGQVWMALSATIDKRAALDEPVVVAPGSSPEVVVTLTSRLGDLSGRLVDGQDRPVPGLALILFPADRARWRRDARFTRIVPPGTDGAYEIRGLLPGEYLVAAIGDYDQADLGDESFYEVLAPAAIKVTITAGEKTVQDIRIAG